MGAGWELGWKVHLGHSWRSGVAVRAGSSVVGSARQWAKRTENGSRLGARWEKAGSSICDMVGVAVLLGAPLEGSGSQWAQREKMGADTKHGGCRTVSST